MSLAKFILCPKISFSHVSPFWLSVSKPKLLVSLFFFINRFWILHISVHVAYSLLFPSCSTLIRWESSNMTTDDPVTWWTHLSVILFPSVLARNTTFLWRRRRRRRRREKEKKEGEWEDGRSYEILLCEIKLQKHWLPSLTPSLAFSFAHSEEKAALSRGPCGKKLREVFGQQQPRNR